MTEDGISRTQAKKQRKELEELGKQLIGLSAAELKSAPLTEQLRDAAVDGQRMKKQAYRRQLLYLGRLLSELGEEVDAVRDFVEGGRRRDRSEDQAFHALELWRDRLLAEGDAAIDQLVGEHPQADRQRLRQLVRKAQEEREQERPPAAARRLFKDLRELFEAERAEAAED